MTEQDLTVTVPYTDFGADGDAFASHTTDPGPSPWPLAGPALFVAFVVAFLVLRGVGVLPS